MYKIFLVTHFCITDTQYQYIVEAPYIPLQEKYVIEGSVNDDRYFAGQPVWMAGSR